jgi:electron transport complex protein RnfG
MSEKKKEGKASLFKPAIVLLIICMISGLLLGYVDGLTRPVISKLDEQTKKDAMAEVFADADSFGDSKEDKDITYAQALDKDGKTLGYVLETTVNGYGGDIDVMVGIKQDGTINKAKVVSADDETPGLGQNTKKESFIGQFTGKSGTFKLVKTSPSSSDEIQAVTSATISSTAVTKAVNSMTEYFSENLKEAG